MKRISRRNFMKIVGAGAAALGLAACGGSESESAASTAASQFTGEAVTATYPLAQRGQDPEHLYPQCHLRRGAELS